MVGEERRVEKMVTAEGKSESAMCERARMRRSFSLVVGDGDEGIVDEVEMQERAPSTSPRQSHNSAFRNCNSLSSSSFLEVIFNVERNRVAPSKSSISIKAEVMRIPSSESRYVHLFISVTMVLSSGLAMRDFLSEDKVSRASRVRS